MITVPPITDPAAVRITAAAIGGALLITVAVLRTVPRRPLGAVLSGVLVVAGVVALLVGAAGVQITATIIACVVIVVGVVLALAWL